MAVIGHYNYPHWVYALYVGTVTCTGFHSGFLSRGGGGGLGANTIITELRWATIVLLFLISQE